MVVPEAQIDQTSSKSKVSELDQESGPHHLNPLDSSTSVWAAMAPIGTGRGYCIEPDSADECELRRAATFG